MEKYFQVPKAKGHGKFKSLAFPIWDVSIWNVSQIITPVDGDATGGFTITTDLRSLLVKAAARAGAWKEALLLSEGIESWMSKRRCSRVDASVGSIFCWTVKTPRYVLCCFDLKTFSNLEKCFTDSSIWGSAESHIFCLLRSYLFSPRSHSCVTFKMLWNQWQGLEFQLQTSQAFSWVEKKYNELFIPTLPLFIFGPSVLWEHPSENMFGCSII